MSLREINESLMDAWSQVFEENFRPKVFTLNFMGSRYYTFDDSDEYLYEFYSISKDGSGTVNVYKANAKKCTIMQDEDGEEYYELLGEFNLVVITTGDETNSDMIHLLNIHHENMNNL